jgi:enoyl-CoA hydratase/carnithine racemase
MKFSLLHYERSDDVATITLARGDKANALSSELVEEFHAVLATIAEQGVGVLVIRGDGKHFCAGFDLSNLDQENDESLIGRLERAESLLQAIYYAPFATVALVHGGAYGAGFDLAMSCDYRIASHNATFRMPSWKMGIAIGTQRLISRIGAETAFQCLRSAAVLNANEALDKKFVTEIADLVTWSRRVDEIVQQVRSLDADAYARLKRLTLSDTRATDMRALIDSLTATPLKPRMQRYLASLNKQRA